MQKITELPKELEEKILTAINNGIEETVQTVVDKPWGSYTDLYRNTYRVLKVITVKPDQRLSLQSHKKRIEIWLVEFGRGQVQKGYEELETKDIEPGDVISIGIEEVHRLINNSKQDLIILELQYGLCDENDIERYEDDYDRV